MLSQSLGIPIFGEIPSLMLNPSPSPETSVKQKSSASSPNYEKADPPSFYQHPYPECSKYPRFLSLWSGPSQPWSPYPVGEVLRSCPKWTTSAHSHVSCNTQPIPRNYVSQKLTFGLSQLINASTFFRSTSTPGADTTCPKNLPSVSQNLHLLNLAYN